MKNAVRVALVGNPNVGKSTVFNLLTGLNQHTGNWPGKTVSVSEGKMIYENREYIFVDLPGTYSLFYNSPEEEITSQYLSGSDSDITLIVCDESALERNLILALQAIEISKKPILCLNMADEAKKKGVEIDKLKLSELLNIPVIEISARKKSSSKAIIKAIDDAISKEYTPAQTEYVSAIKEAIEEKEKELNSLDKWQKRRVALYDLENGKGVDEVFSRYGYNEKMVKEKISYSFVKASENISQQVIKKYKENKISNLDKIITGKYTSYFFIFIILGIIFWITIVGANYPSMLLSDMFVFFEEKISKLFISINLHPVITDILLNGLYKVVTWVVSVMLPPMMIFFPLFTFLEDFGYLPRLAFCVDSSFQKFNACGKQALTYCMSFGCNAAGIVSSRIIDSQKEKLIAIATNNFIPCNGRFPILISIISIFLMQSIKGKYSSVVCALFLTVFIFISVSFAMITSKILSLTILKSEDTSYTLELPDYRKPQFGKIIIRSVFDRTLFVLARAVAVAAPAGLLIWFLANVKYNDVSILRHISLFLDPVGKIFGMDGVLLLSFILGLPANEIVIPIALMCYFQNGNLIKIEDLNVIREIFLLNGWTLTTAICVIVFTIMHWPCSTTIVTIYKETKSIKWTLLSVVTPTVCGLALCFIINLISKII